MPYGYGSTNRERGAEKARSSSSSSKSKSSSTKSSNTRSNNLGDNDRQSYSAKQYTNSGISASRVKASKESFENAVGKARLDNYKVKNVPPYVPGSTILNIFSGPRQKLFEGNRKFFREKVLKSKNPGKYKDTLDSYSDYMTSRLSGNIDAYGNTIQRGDRNPEQIQKQVILEIEKEIEPAEQKITAQRKVFKNYRSALRRRFLMEEAI